MKRSNVAKKDAQYIDYEEIKDDRSIASQTKITFEASITSPMEGITKIEITHVSIRGNDMKAFRYTSE